MITYTHAYTYANQRTQTRAHAYFLRVSPDNIRPCQTDFAWTVSPSSLESQTPSKEI